MDQYPHFFFDRKFGQFPAPLTLHLKNGSDSFLIVFQFAFSIAVEGNVDSKSIRVSS
jgi:hypothetical protein